MPEALILPPTSPDLMGIAIVTQQREESVREFGVVASSIVGDPEAKILDYDGYASHETLKNHKIHRLVVSKDDESIQLRIRLNKSEVTLKDLLGDRIREYRVVNEATKEAARQKAIQDFMNAIQSDPTLDTVEFESIELEVAMADGGLSCCIAKEKLGSINFNDEFFQYFLVYFRRHIKARGSL
ncbi:MAG: hypothetical protein QG623_483 [Patescibacteria group bacterium]|nr:hypothetical protein [Patescibacteria group bacterium]